MMTNNRNRNSNSDAGTHQLATENRIHGFMATQRRQLDESQREASRSKERRDLLRTQNDAQAKSLLVLGEELDEMKKQVNEEAEERLEVSRKENEALEREVDFQHSELVNKRNKIENMTKTMEHNDQVREQKLALEDESLRTLLQQVSKMEREAEEERRAMAPHLALELVKVEMGGGSSFTEERLWVDWMKVVEEKAKLVESSNNQCERANEKIANMLKGYKNHYGVGDVGADGNGENVQVGFEQ